MCLVATILFHVNKCAVRCGLLGLPPSRLSTYLDFVVMATLGFAVNVKPISNQCYTDVETSRLICAINQLTGFYMNEILAKEYMSQGSRLNLIQIWFSGMGPFLIGVMLPYLEP